jgi:hypothetical protein
MSTQLGDLHAGIEFLKSLFGPSTEHSVYVCSLLNDKGAEGQSERHIADRDETTLTIFCNHWDRYTRGLFFCVATIKAGSRRNRANALELPALHGDIDFKSIREDPATVIGILMRMRLPPTVIVSSGHGLHCYWFFREALDVQANIDRIEAALKLLADTVGGDMQVTHAAALMRLPGSHNTKGDQWLDVTIVQQTDARYELEDIEEWLAEQSPVITRKDRPVPPEQNPYLAIAEQLQFKTPIDVEQRLAAMRYQGEGDASIHATQVSVSAALLTRGEDPDQVVEMLLRATQHAAGGYGERWNWCREESNIRRMCVTWQRKMGAQERRSDGAVGIADIVHLDQARAQRAAQQPATQPAPTLIQAKPFLLRDPKTLPKRKRLYGTHFFRKFTSATFGPTGSSKTNISIAEALAMSSGKALLGILPPHRSRVWLWNGEDPYDELERRIGAACLHYHLEREDLEGWLFVNSGRDSDSPIKLASQSAKGIIIAVPTVDAIIATIRQHSIDVVLIDPFISTHSVVENDNTAIDAVAKTWGYIADVTDTAINLSHHTRKTGGAEVSVEDGRGAVALLNAVRPARVVNVMTEAEAASAGVEDGRKRYFRISDGKNNLSLPVDKVNWFRSASVNLENIDPNDPFDMEGDEVGVVTTWSWPDPLEGVTGADFERAAAVIRGGKWRENPQCKVDWVGVAVAKALRFDLSDKADRVKVSGLIKIWLASGALVKTEGLDKKRMPRTYIEVADNE